MVYLMYHELELPGRPLCQNEPGYVRYVVKLQGFESQMQWLRTQSWSGMSVSEALSSSKRGVAITFDDGCETDLLSAAPTLKQANFNATFYVTVGFLGMPGYMSRSQVRQLSDLGFEIGSHSMTHAYVSDLSDGALQAEVANSKNELEQMTGRSIEHFSCPGGRWDKRVARFARQAGYGSVATSRSVANSSGAVPFRLGRVAVMRGTDPCRFQQLCQGHGLWRLQAQDLIRATAKSIFGNSSYDRMRSILLGRNQ
jgi:peptidoglycan/xylan/chitin deacetylase (PgdA/CDA1 family)